MIVALCFMMPELTMTGKIIWVAVTYTLQGMASTALLIPLNTLMGRLSSDKQQRAHLNQIAGFYGTAAGWIVPAAARICRRAFCMSVSSTVSCMHCAIWLCSGERNI